MKDFLAKQQFWAEIFYFEHGTVLKKTHSHFIHVHVGTVCPETVVIKELTTNHFKFHSTRNMTWDKTMTYDYMYMYCSIDNFIKGVLYSKFGQIDNILK